MIIFSGIKLLYIPIGIGLKDMGILVQIKIVGWPCPSFCRIKCAYEHLFSSEVRVIISLNICIDKYMYHGS